MKLWTSDEDAILIKMRNDGASYLTIGKALSRGADGVKSRYDRIVTLGARERPFTADDDAEIKRLTAAGYNNKQIGAMMGNRTANSIRERVAELIDYSGISFTKFMTERKMRKQQAYDWLFRRGYDLVGDVVSKRQSIFEIEMEIAKRREMAPPSGPCWRCGARSCAHMVPVWSAAA